ncbi:AMP-binding protein [Arenimonas sp. MALMAid1274]|uniref:AMP-binding protein n=1 Tax=Arenimonas sp. MALMAid1274 TaxID=3411630 RepID=UPI003BA22B4E
MKPFGSQVPSVLAQREFRNVASAAFDAGKTLPQLLIEACQRHGDRPAVSNLGHRLSFRDIDRLSADFAAYLRHDLGLAAGERVAIMLPNLLQYPVAVLGVQRADLVAVLVNPMYTARELRHQLVDSGASVLLVLENFGAVAAEALPGTPVRQVITTRVADHLSWPKSALVNFVVKRVKKMVPPFSLPGALPWPTALARGAAHPRVVSQAHATDTAQLQYTGGTTGLSKGAVLPHRALVANVAAAEQCFGLAMDPATDVFVICLPIYHIAAFTNLVYTLTHGYHAVLVTNPRDIPALVATLDREKPAFFSGVNTLYDALMNSPDFARLDLSGMKLCLQGGTALRRGTAERWKQLTGKDVVEGYGLSETSAAITYNRWDGPNPVGSIGLALGEVEISLRDESGREVAPGEAGELCARGPQMTTGYWQQPEETRVAFFEGGWFRTGDIARQDEQGYYFLLDRRKDMILVSGFNVFPNEIEDVVALHPGVLEAAVVGMPDEKCGEAVRLVVVRRDPALTEDDLRAHCRKNLTGYKQPKRIEFRDSLPKSAVGKILRRELR